MSIGWPSGIKILLDHGADSNVTDRDGERPVEHAVARLCLDSLTLLEEASCPLNSLRTAANLEYAGKVDKVKLAIIIDYSIAMEARRRQNLQTLIVNYLPKELILRLLPFGDRLIDIYAVQGASALQQRSISIPRTLEFFEPAQTVYHVRYLTSKVQESLWGAGFRDINEPNWKGQTPVMILGPIVIFHPWAFGCPSTLENVLERIEWFETKGVDLNEKVQDIIHRATCIHTKPIECSYLTSSHTVSHFLAFHLAFAVDRQLDFAEKGVRLLEKRHLESLRRIITKETQDACKCACSSAGCRAICNFLKGLDGYHVARGDSELCCLRGKMWSTIPWSMLIITEPTSKEIFFDILRFLTFHMLDLTHTCCRKKVKYEDHALDLVQFEDEEEIREIHEEEREDLQCLEDLLLGFEHQRRESDCSNKDFFDQYWWPRMREVLPGVADYCADHVYLKKFEKSRRFQESKKVEACEGSDDSENDTDLEDFENATDLSD